jgi:hypothetical protein
MLCGLLARTHVLEKVKYASKIPCMELRIIASRLRGTGLVHLDRTDLELETVGFDAEQVNNYVEKYSYDHAEEIKSFIKRSWLLQGLFQVPIQLEALCDSWDVVPRAQGAVPTTMTTLYQAIEQKLWKKNATRLKNYKSSQDNFRFTSNSQRWQRITILKFLSFL